MDFFLFLLLNFTLFVRPSDFMPGYEQVSIYNYVILATLAVSLPQIANLCQPDRLLRDPITACVLGLIPAVALSHLSRFDTWSARTLTWDFTKVVIYYLLLVSVVNSTQRLRVFLYAVALFATTTSAIAVLDYYDLIEIPSLQAFQQVEVDQVTGEISFTPRLCATGIFNDPNDLAMIAVFAMAICMMGLCDQSMGPLRIVWIAPLAFLFVAVVLTKSRGGMVAFMAGAGVLSYFRFRFWKTAAAALVVVPVLIMAVGGRQTDLSSGISGGTGESRVELWSDGLIAMRQSPLFGIGYQNYVESCGQVAHNSFVHCFVELGLFGGALFLGAFWFSASSLWKLRIHSNPSLQFLTTDSFSRLQPFVMAGVLGFAVSQFSLSRPYVVPTYLIFGAANVFSLESQRQGVPAVVELDMRRIGELLFVSVTFLIGIYIFIRFGFR